MRSEREGVLLRYRKALLMEEHTCPWWFGYTFDNPLRGLLHNPARVLGNFVRRGFTPVLGH